MVKDSYCILLVKSEESQISPVVSDLLGTGLFMPTPSKETRYSLSDYEIKRRVRNYIFTLLLQKRKNLYESFENDRQHLRVCG